MFRGVSLLTLMTSAFCYTHDLLFYVSLFFVPESCYFQQQYFWAAINVTSGYSNTQGDHACISTEINPKPKTSY